MTYFALGIVFAILAEVVALRSLGLNPTEILIVNIGTGLAIGFTSAFIIGVVQDILQEMTKKVP